ncbi:hypothetical protein HK104_001556 [Borealophlyctis nickersoniae]|nr:hypothetical protein HK104_001556 [Borealophlyctis nickersoniae]
MSGSLTAFTTKWVLNISVENPNWFEINLQDVNGTGYSKQYANGTVPIGTGLLPNVNIPGRTTTYIPYPLSVTYDLARDPSFSFIRYLYGSCGGGGSPKQKLEVEYQVDAKAKLILWMKDIPTYRSSTAFECPLDLSSLPGALGSVLGLLKGVGLKRRAVRGLVGG